MQFLKTIHLPMWLTRFRLLSIPIFVVFFYAPFTWGHWVAAGVFLLASLTDWLDGYLARNLSQETALGAFLDPVADKLLVATALLLIVSLVHTAYLCIPAAVIVCREISISALREWMAQVGMQVRVKVARVAKVKTTFQMIALLLLILYRPDGGYYSDFFLYAGSFFLYIAVLLTLWSMLAYLRAAWPTLVAR